MAFVISLDHITPADASRMGGKAYHCARLKQCGFPVPEGAAIAAEAMGSAAALAELNAWLSQLPADVLLAVRSSASDEDSAGHSFAGIHETRLNVPRELVSEAVRACWNSVQSERALAYRRVVGLTHDVVNAGVLVQMMVQPVVAGVAFTMDPVTDRPDELVISACWGLGEALVGGLVEPDEFRVRKSDGVVVQQHVGGKQYRVLAEQGASRLVETHEDERAKPALNDEQVHELAALIVRLEQHFGAPQDVEWCHEGRQFWILQSRPITTAPRVQAEIEWTRANVREVLPDLPSPQTLSMCINLLNRGFLQYYGRLLAPAQNLGPMAKAFCGRLYFNLSQFRHLCKMTGTPLASVLRAMGHAEAIRPEDEGVPPAPLGPRLQALSDMLRLLWVQLTLPRLVAHELARIQRTVDTELAVRELARLTDSEICSSMVRWQQEAPRVLRVVLAMGGVMLYEFQLHRLCGWVGFPAERLLLARLSSGERSVSAQQAFELLALAGQARRELRARNYFLSRPGSFEDYREALSGTKFLQQFEDYLGKYGHRGKHESDWALPRYREDPTPLLLAVQAHVGAADCPAPESILARQEMEAAQVWDAFMRQLRPWQRIAVVPLVRRLLNKIKRMYLWREQCRSEMMRAGLALRRWHLVLAERLGKRGWLEQRDDYFFLTLEEISDAVAGKLTGEQIRNLVSQRKVERSTWEKVELPLLMRESELPALIRRASASLPESDVTMLHGLCVSPGRAEGEVVVIREPSDFACMQGGAILVAPATDPGWTPLFTLAAGVVVEVGGTLSHASIVAREYGLPALANVKDATRLLKNCDRVALDATSGFVQVLARGRRRAHSSGA